MRCIHFYWPASERRPIARKRFVRCVYERLVSVTSANRVDQSTSRVRFRMFLAHCNCIRCDKINSFGWHCPRPPCIEHLIHRNYGQFYTHFVYRMVCVWMLRLWPVKIVIENAIRAHRMNLKWFYDETSKQTVEMVKFDLFELSVGFDPMLFAEFFRPSAILHKNSIIFTPISVNVTLKLYNLVVFWSEND